MKIQDTNPTSEWGIIKAEAKLELNPDSNKRLFVVDNFYKDPH